MSDAFMRGEITCKQDGWKVETRDAGTCFVPGHIASVPDWLALGKPVMLADDDHDTLDGGLFNLLLPLLADYIPGRHVESIEVCSGYFARLSAPGYLDCTDWVCYSTIREARAALKDI